MFALLCAITEVIPANNVEQRTVTDFQKMNLYAKVFNAAADTDEGSSVIETARVGRRGGERSKPWAMPPARKIRAAISLNHCDVAALSEHDQHS